MYIFKIDGAKIKDLRYYASPSTEKILIRAGAYALVQKNKTKIVIPR